MNANTIVKKKIIIAASGSGGHLIPGITLGAQALKNHNNSELILLTGTDNLDTMLSTQAKEIQKIIQIPLKKRKNMLSSFLLIPELIIILLRMLKLFYKERPACIITTGGLISIPALYAARLLKLPVRAYELNAIPGLAMKVCIPILKEFFSPFVHHHKKWRPCDYPVREEVLHKKNTPATSPPSYSEKIISHHAIFRDNKQLFTLFIQGGSQGSHALNTHIIALCNYWAQQDIINKERTSTQAKKYRELKDIFIIHQTGAKDQELLASFYHDQKIAAHVFSFESSVADYYHQAACFIGRAGAGFIFEAALYQKPTILIPLITSTTAHQKDNALAIQQLYPALFTLFDQQEIAQKPELLFTYLQMLSSSAA